MKDLFKVLKKSDKIGFKLTAICGLNWLIRWLFRLQFLVFEMIVCAVLIKEISATLEISPNYLGFFMLLPIFLTALEFPFQENESSLWLLMALLSFGIYQFMKWFQANLFQRYLFKNVLNKEYLGIKKATDPFPPEINLYVDADENDAEKRMVMINKRAVKEAYQEIVELSFLNIERFTGVVYYRESLSGFKAPLKKKFSNIINICQIEKNII